MLLLGTTYSGKCFQRHIKALEEEINSEIRVEAFTMLLQSVSQSSVRFGRGGNLVLCILGICLVY